MGQKANPTSLRLGVNRTWDSRWYADDNYAGYLHEDVKIKEFLKKKLAQAGISRIVIERPAKKARVTIHSARPGVVIGKKGQDIEALRKEIQSMTASEVQLNILEVRKPELDAQLVADSVDDERVQIVLAEAGGKGIDTGFSAATIQLGKMGIIHGAKTLVIQNEDGQIEEPYSISAGLDYPGIGPMHANLAKQQRALVLAINDDEAIRAAFELTRLEGIIPALESAHALGALDKMRFKPTDIVVLTVSGRGDKDIETYLKESGTRTSLQ